MLLADVTAAELVGGGVAVVTAVGAAIFTFMDRRRAGRDRDDASAKGRRDELRAEWNELFARQQKEIDQLRGDVEESRAAEVRCGRRLERSDAFIEYIQDVLDNAGIKYRRFKPADESGEHSPLERRAAADPARSGPERRGKPHTYGGADVP